MPLNFREPRQPHACLVPGDPSPPAMLWIACTECRQSASHANSIGQVVQKTLGLWDKACLGWCFSSKHSRAHRKTGNAFALPVYLQKLWCGDGQPYYCRLRRRPRMLKAAPTNMRLLGSGVAVGVKVKIRLLPLT